MEIKGIIQSQYLASLEMLKSAIVECPDSMWDDPGPGNKFWQVAFHAIFYSHLYLQSKEEDFKAWEKHRDEYQFMGTLPWPPHDEPKIGEPYTRAEVLVYLELCQEQVKNIIPLVDLESSESGFSWLPFGKLELQFYNIRHLQQHIGELCERLGSEAGVNVNWVGIAQG
jgi:hypothetical protein